MPQNKLIQPQEIIQYRNHGLFLAMLTACKQQPLTPLSDGVLGKFIYAFREEQEKDSKYKFSRIFWKHQLYIIGFLITVFLR